MWRGVQIQRKTPTVWLSRQNLKWGVGERGRGRGGPCVSVCPSSSRWWNTAGRGLLLCKSPPDIPRWLVSSRPHQHTHWPTKFIISLLDFISVTTQLTAPCNQSNISSIFWHKRRVLTFSVQIIGIYWILNLTYWMPPDILNVCCHLCMFHDFKLAKRYIMNAKLL